VSNHP